MGTDSNTNLEGRTLGGRFDVLELLGSGGMGAVYRVYDRELDDVVALKLVHDSDEPVMVERFRREVKLARRVTHHNVARTFELVRAEGLVCCTMELVEGQSLGQRLRGGALSVEQAVAIARAVCAGLAVAHAVGVIHRDIKPGNVLLGRDGRIVLADFGVAAIETGQIAGTPPYMSPEQARGEEPTPAFDVYAIGVVMYEMLTGRPAFTGSTEAIFAAKEKLARLELPAGNEAWAEIGRVIARATARDPAARIATADELARLLAPWPDTSLQVHAAQRSDERLRIVVLVPPVATEPKSALHVAYAVYEDLLAALAALPRLRVISGPSASARACATLVTILAGDALTLTITPVDKAAFTMQLSMRVTDLAISVEAACAAIRASIDGNETSASAPPEALELWLRARALSHRNTLPDSQSLELLARAAALAPDDPRIAAALAMAEVRHTFFMRTEISRRLAHARELVDHALRIGADRVESHLAAGHLELATGDATVAARHFRRAITCAPRNGEAHELLGRMLLEAGWLHAGFERIEDALRSAPAFSGTQWDVARAYALQGRWSEYDQLITWLQGQGSGRLLQQLRFSLWRGDTAFFAKARTDSHNVEPAIRDAMFATVLEGRWDGHRDAVMRFLHDHADMTRRRRAFLYQIAAELAAFAGDRAACSDSVIHAVNAGLFDLHWLTRCPLLVGFRDSAAYGPVHAQVARRADAIHDALHGDLDASPDAETVALRP